jgi:deazaflavin-dependent oxidoreductase (nitroreductase family)
MATLTVRQNAFQRFNQLVPGSRLGAALFSKFLHHIDKPLMKMSGGRVSVPQLVTGLPCVRLTSTGAKSGHPRETITIGIPDGRNIALVCSNWGQAHHPAWYHNLKANPRATLGFDGHVGPYIATEVTDEKEYQRLWGAACAVYSGYPKYRLRTGRRRIPIMLMRPV